MAVYKCSVCGYVYDEEKEGKPFSELTACPICKQPVSKFTCVSGDPAPAPAEAAPEGGDLAYPAAWVRHDPKCRYMEEIHEMAVTGKSLHAAMGTQLPLPAWEDILLLGAQLNPPPLNDEDPVETKTVIGPHAKKPMILENPVFISHMSFGALSRETKIALAAQSANHTAQEASFEVTSNELFITRGTDGYTVDEDAVFNFIRDTLLSGASKTTDEFSEAKTGSGDGEDVDLDAIYDQVFRQPENARIDTATGQIVAAVNGISFDKEAARALLASSAPGETVRVPLIVTEPEITGSGVEALLFKDKLAEKSTTLSTSTANRINNITLAAAAINGFVMNPGEEFDFNKVVGQRTTAKGYKSAGAYVGGRHVDSIGGGICQVSSTLYYCTLIADLETVERTNHGYTVSYLPAGLDATVSWPNLNFRFKNNANFPVKIVAWVEKKELYVELWGTKENDHRIELESNIISRKDYETVEEVDESLKPGQRKTANSGQAGITSEAYKLVYDGSGKLLSRTLISKDVYKPMTKVVLVGPPDTPAGGGDTTTPDTGGTTPDTGDTTPDTDDTTPDTPDTGDTTPETEDTSPDVPWWYDTTEDTAEDTSEDVPWWYDTTEDTSEDTGGDQEEDWDQGGGDVPVAG